MPLLKKAQCNGHSMAKNMDVSHRENGGMHPQSLGWADGLYMYPLRFLELCITKIDKYSNIAAFFNTKS